MIMMMHNTCTDAEQYPHVVYFDVFAKIVGTQALPSADVLRLSVMQIIASPVPIQFAQDPASAEAADRGRSHASLSSTPEEPPEWYWLGRAFSCKYIASNISLPESASGVVLAVRPVAVSGVCYSATAAVFIGKPA